MVLVAAGSPAAGDVPALVLVAALAAQFVADSVASRAREWLHKGASLREQLAQSSWVYLVDALLSPIGFAIALAAAAEPAAVALCWPLFALLGLFAHERDERVRSVVELSEAYRGTARVLGEVVEHDDAYTGVHIRGVAELAVEIAADLDLDAKQRRLVEFGALLHDVGKIAIPKEIIQKPGPLDELEWRVIRTHTIEGQRMLAGIGGLMRDVGDIVRSSHEPSTARLPRRAGRLRDPDRGADRVLLRRLRRDDHRPRLSRGAHGRGRDHRAARQRRDPVRSDRGRRAAQPRRLALSGVARPEPRLEAPELDEYPSRVAD